MKGKKMIISDNKEPVTVYGYDIRTLILIADVMRKKGITAEEALDLLKNSTRMFDHIFEQFQETVRQAMIQTTFENDPVVYIQIEMGKEE